MKAKKPAPRYLGWVYVTAASFELFASPSSPRSWLTGVIKSLRGYVMHKKNQTKKHYTPQFSELACVSVRRYAWALGKPMPAAVDSIIRILPYIIEPSKVCPACKDNSKCQTCTFNTPQLSPEEQLAILEAL